LVWILCGFNTLTNQYNSEFENRPKSPPPKGRLLGIKPADGIKAILLLVQGFTYREIENISRSKSKRLKELLQKYIPEKFHLIEPMLT
jgi:hypothetical protein